MCDLVTCVTLIARLKTLGVNLYSVFSDIVFFCLFYIVLSKNIEVTVW